MRLGIIGDVHCDPNHDSDLQRLTDVGTYFASLDLDAVVQIGDWYDMPSITEHRGKLEREGDRYDRDIECGNQGLAQFMRGFKKRKKKKPDFYFIEGNHEYRIQRYVQQHPSMAGKLGRHEFDFERHGWRVATYGRYASIGGFWFTHCVIGKAGRAVALGPTFQKRGVSLVVGHSHELQHLVLPRQDKLSHGIDVGCFTQKGYSVAEDWSAPNQHTTWRGVHVMTGVEDGDYQTYEQVRAEIFTNG